MPKAKTKKTIPLPPPATASVQELSSYFEKYGLEELEAAGYVSDLTPAENADMEKLASHTKERVEAKKNVRTQLNLALSIQQLERFTKYANQKHLPASTLARAWLLERLDIETGKSLS
jgi:hypothetical protein